MINIFNVLFLCMLRICLWSTICLLVHGMAPANIYQPPVRPSPRGRAPVRAVGPCLRFLTQWAKLYTKKKYFVLGHLTVHFLINTIHYRSKLHLQTPHSSIWSNVLLLPDTSFRHALGLLRNLNAGLPACIYSGQPAPIISAILLFFFVHIETISTCSIWSLSFKCHHAHQRLLLIFLTFNSHAMCRQSIVDAPFDHDV